MKIPITKAWFGPEEAAALQTPLETGWVVQGPRVAEFERKFAAYTGARHAAAATSCTTALHLAVTALGLAPGDEVIVPAFTWVATANVVEYQGATPIFCDIDPETYNLDPRQLDSKISRRTVGIIPVHLFGLCAEMSQIQAFAQRHGLWIVEDAACGFGAWYRGQHAGTFGEMGCFSFHPRKAITTGEGGMVVTGDTILDARVRSLRDHGATKSDLARHHAAGAFLLPEFPHVGFNYRMTDFQGAVGSVQMDRAPTIQERRAFWADEYRKRLADVSWLQMPKIPEHHVHGYQSFVASFEPETVTATNVDRLGRQRNELMLRLEQAGIATRQGTHTPPLLDFFAKKYGHRSEDFPGAVRAEKLSLALPLYAQMTDEEHRYVCDQIVRAAEKSLAA